MIDVADFIVKSKGQPIIDVRSESEFTRGRIPGSINLPLFHDSERAEVGTLYKKEGRDKAIALGLTFTGYKLKSFFEKSLQITENRSRTLFIYCWRGGMRSASVASFLGNLGFEVLRLQGGYKSFRRYCLEQVEKPLNVCIIGGYTGTDKTGILHALRENSEQVIDLEGLACHRGSAFGHLKKGQPTQEQFENELGLKMAGLDSNKLTFIEDESRNIGRAHIPVSLWKQMRSAIVLKLQLSDEERIENLCRIYQHEEVANIIQGFKTIEKKLGKENVKSALEFIEQNDYASAVNLALGYYDRGYNIGLSKRNPDTIIPVPITNQKQDTVNKIKKILSSNMQLTTKATYESS